MTDEQFKFHLEEYRLLKAEDAQNIKFIYDTFIWAALSSGGIAAWLLANADRIAELGAFQSRAAWFIPLLVASVAFMANRHFIGMVRRSAAYYQRLEESVAMPGMGWQTVQGGAAKAVERSTDWRMGIGWVILGLADVALAIFVR